MKWRNKILISLFVIPLLLLSCLISPLSINNVKAKSEGYTQKVVAVVFDDSGSMGTDKRIHYAKYAMQVLMATLDYKDVMKVFTLNDRGFEVNLAADDRDAEVANKVNTLMASGGTDYGAVKGATEWMATDHGLNTQELVEGKEYWLIIISDGEFTTKDANKNIIGKKSEDVIRETISVQSGASRENYVGLQTAYFGICLDKSNDNVFIDELVKENSAVAAYYTDTAEQIVLSMQEITNKTTGRYQMTTGITQNGNVVEVDLSTYGFSIVSMSVLAQGSTAGVKLKDPEGIVCEGGRELKKFRECNLESSEVNMYGCSAVISPADGGFFNGEKITLTFEGQPTNVSIMLEPAIKLDSTLQYNDNGEWKDISVEDVNTTLKKGAELRARYRLLDSNTNKDLTSILTNVEANVSYNGKTFNYEQGFALELGKKEVSLSVVVNISGSKYTLYNSWLCDIDENPQDFRIESKLTEGYGGDKEKVKIDYTIYYDDVKVDEDDLTGSNALLSWELVELTNPVGDTITPEKAVVNFDGTISIIFKTSPGEYGAYTSKLKVVCLENRRYRTNTAELKYYPSSISIAVGDTKELTLTTNELKKNIENFEFSISANGYPISFDSGVVGYALKVDGVDVSASAIIDQNKLKFIPDDVSLTGKLQNVGDRNITLEVWSAQDSSIKDSKTVKLTLIKPTYVIESISGENTTVDIYDLRNSTAKTYFKVKVDEEWLNKQELEEGLANNTIKLDTHPFGWTFLLPAKVDVEVVEQNGEALICCSVSSDCIRLFEGLFASFIKTGDKTLTLICGDSTADGIITLNDVELFSRIWRWIIVLIIICVILHIVLYLVGFVVAKPLPRGAVIELTLNTSDGFVRGKSTFVNVNRKNVLIWRYLQRFIPGKWFMNQKKKITPYKLDIIVDEQRQIKMLHKTERFKVDFEFENMGDVKATILADFIDELKRKSSPKTSKIKDREIRACISSSEEEIKSGTTSDFDLYYITKDAKSGKINTIVFFRYR